MEVFLLVLLFGLVHTGKDGEQFDQRQDFAKKEDNYEQRGEDSFPWNNLEQLAELERSAEYSIKVIVLTMNRWDERMWDIIIHGLGNKARWWPGQSLWRGSWDPCLPLPGSSTQTRSNWRFTWTKIPQEVRIVYKSVLDRLYVRQGVGLWPILHSSILLVDRHRLASPWLHPFGRNLRTAAWPWQCHRQNCREKYWTQVIEIVMVNIMVIVMATMMTSLWLGQAGQ